MVVCGRDVYVISKSGQVVEVNAFAKECGVLQILIIDAAVVFEDPYNGNIYFLVIGNALYVESMDHHLIPPFIMREAGLVVNAKKWVYLGIHRSPLLSLVKAT